ncbi:MAG: type II secretion system secretin GspD, partial [Pseudomonadota bacterium]
MNRTICAVAACAVLLGCAESDTVDRGSFIQRMLPTPVGQGEGTSAARNQGRVTGGRVATAGEGTIFPGRVPLVRDSDFRDANGDQTVSLTLVDVTIAEAAQAILGELLGENYLVDPNVTGTVNIQSAQPISRATAIEVFELALKQNGAALVKREDVFAIVPLNADLAVGATTARDVPPGFTLRVVPLRNIGAQEMAAILQPFANNGIVGIDTQRNLIVLAGTSGDQRAWQKTINSFDVDWMSNRSVGIFPIKGRSAQSIINGLERIVETDEAFEPIAAFEVIPENNSILVVAKTPRGLESMATWIKRLTREGQNDAQIYSYDMKFARASEVAPTLSSILGIEVKATSSEAGAEAMLEAEAQAGAGTENAVRVVASEATNTLLIHAPDDEYKRILGVLHRLDVPPRQVLVEATIVEVTLTDQLRYGVQYFFDNDSGDTIGLTRSTTTTSIAPQVPGFSLTLNQGPEVVIDALESETEINVVSSPNLMILNNQSARLVVGDRVPVATQQATDSSENNSVFVSTVEFQDTGVIFEVTPRINSSGAVTLDITQEVSSVGATDEATLTPTISQRIIDSSVSVDSGETIVLGGLFSANQTKGNGGIPVL